MEFLENLIAIISPKRAYERAGYHHARAAYEAAKPSRTRNTKPDNASGDAVVGRAGSALRGHARQLEQNYDLASGVLDVLVDRVIGPIGIKWEPLPKRMDGTLHKEFAKELKKFSKELAPTLNVTWELDQVETERLAARTLFRDGEFLVQFLEGSIPGLDHGSKVPFSIELIESDQLPFELNDYSKGITQGVERSSWKRPLAYHIYKEHPGGTSYRLDIKTKRIPADRMLHPKLIARMNQARGVTIFASCVTRIEDIKDYEESERTAARIASKLVAYIKKGAPEEYSPPMEGTAQRIMKMQPGMVVDGLRTGEDIGTLESNRPSSLLTPFHDTMTRRVSAATRTNNSSVSRNYNGTYSAQRQEQVESQVAYEGLTRLFVGMYTKPVKQRSIQIGVLSGVLKIPKDLDISTLFDADYRGPPMLSIDALKDIKSKELAERAGYKSPQQNIRDMNGDPEDVREQTKQWREANDADGLVFTTDAKHDKPQMTNESPANAGDSSLGDDESEKNKNNEKDKDDAKSD